MRPFAPRLLRQHNLPLLPRQRYNSTYQPPSPPSSPNNPHRTFWQSFGRPIAKVFLGALVTYQVAYLGWAKLESLEEEREGDGEIAALEARARALAKKVKAE